MLACRKLDAEDHTAARERLRWTRGPVLYFLLAAFDVLTVSASLYLNHRIMSIYVGSVAANQEWATRMEHYAALAGLAAEVNAPGNDVFDSHDVPAESARMDSALAAFRKRIAVLRIGLEDYVAAEEGEPLLTRMSLIDRAMDEMVAESRLIFSHFAEGRSSLAGERMATMDRKYARLLTELRELSASVATIQRRHFDEQMAAAGALQRFEYVIAGLILLMVCAATFYGLRLARQTAQDARERSHQLAELEVAGTSLRHAHAELESRVKERTRALRESEAALRRAADEWQRTFEAIESPLLLLDREGRTLRLNRAASERVSGADSDVAGRPVASLGDGEPWNAASHVLREVLATRASVTLQARDDTSGKSFEVTGNFVPDAGGNDAERVIIVARDISRIIELQEGIRREERMSAMGSLVAGVAHEVRNPLFGISSTLDAFAARYGETEAFQKYLSVLRHEVERLGSLMRDLLDYGKPSRLEVAEVDFETLAEDAVHLCEGLAAKLGVRVVKHGPWRVGRIPMDRARMLQALENVIVNAIQHSPRGSEVVVDGGVAQEAEPHWVWCSVRDHGAGFRAADLPHVFEPFFTRRSGGTGLGLSIAQRVVTQHGGTLLAGNHSDGGAIVTLHVPPGERLGLA